MRKEGIEYRNDSLKESGTNIFYIVRVKGKCIFLLPALNS